MYIMKVYIVEEYEIDADSRKEAIEKYERGQYEELSQYEEKVTFKKAPQGGGFRPA
jgi:hypothetical protein